MKKLIYGVLAFAAVMISLTAAGQRAPQGKGMLIRSEDSRSEERRVGKEC